MCNFHAANITLSPTESFFFCEQKGRRYEVVKWMVVFAIGVCTGLVSRRDMGRWWVRGVEGVWASSSLANKWLVIITETTLSFSLFFLF